VQSKQAQDMLIRLALYKREQHLVASPTLLMP
jgi:hypothetical protein